MKILTAKGHLSLQEVEEKYKSAKNKIESTHWLVIYHSKLGKAAKEISEIVLYSPGWVKEIIRRYNMDGYNIPGDGRKSNGGHNALLSESEQEKLVKALEERPPDGGLWSGPKVAKYIRKTFGKETMHRGTGWTYLNKLGFSLKVLRPSHAKANKEEQEAFKKNFH